MGANSKIEWCDHTFNPWIGCTPVSAACDHCYAEALAKRHGWAEWGNHPRHRTGESNWRQPLKWNAWSAKRGIRQRVFCASLADVFDNQVHEQWRRDLWELIEETPHLDWLLLTKRPQNIAKTLPPWDMVNVWLGTTVENQQEADRRIPHLLSVPARVHFLSCEPLLGPIDLTNVQWKDGDAEIRAEVLTGEAWVENSDSTACYTNAADGNPSINWVICGGESGPHARPMHPDWARSLRDQCAAAGVPFHFKQWGEWWEVDSDGRDDNGLHHLIDVDENSIVEAFDAKTDCLVAADGKTFRAPHVIPPETRCRWMTRLGKRHAGRLLDGVEHNGFPEPRQREAACERQA